MKRHSPIWRRHASTHAGKSRDSSQALGSKTRAATVCREVSLTLVQFANRDAPKAHDRFQAWRRKNSTGFFLNCKPGKVWMLHRTLCPHHGDTEFSSLEFGSLTNQANENLLGQQAGTSRDRREGHGCRTVTMPGLRSVAQCDRSNTHWSRRRVRSTRAAAQCGPLCRRDDNQPRIVERLYANGV